MGSVLGESCRVHRRIVTLVALALLSTAGCTSVTPGADPGRLSPRGPLWPAGGEAPSPLKSLTPAAVQPPARDALVRSGMGKPKSKRGEEATEKAPRRVKPVTVDHSRPTPTPPARRPVHRAPAPHRPAAQRPERSPEPAAPRPARPRQTYDGEMVCRMADGVTDPATVALCRGQLGR